MVDMIRAVFLLVLVSPAVLGYDVEAEIAELKKVYGENVRDVPQSRHRVQKRFFLSTYCDNTLGCFPTDGPWSERVINFSPSTRENIDTKFRIFSSETPTTGQTLRADNPKTITSSVFKSNRPTKVIVHGFLESAAAVWFPVMNQELLASGDYNVINVNWGGLGGSKTLYTQATANTRVVAAEISYLLRTMKAVANLDYGTVHLIGHSLGAHLMGYVGQNISAIGRITGLDPAEPYFQGYDKAIRLDPSDAKFVDAIHSDADPFLTDVARIDGGLGMIDPVGHADFYPNGGLDQPNCQNGIVKTIDLEDSNLYEGLKRFVACDHDRSIRLFSASVNSCTFSSFRCTSMMEFEKGHCMTKCSPGSDACNNMGFHARKPSTPLTKYYLHTSGHDDTGYCVKVIDLEMTASPRSNEFKGVIDIDVLLSNGHRAAITINKHKELIQPGSVHLYRLALPRIDDDSSVFVKSISATWHRDIQWWRIFTKTCSWAGFCSSTIELLQVKLSSPLSTKQQKPSYFCGNGKMSNGQEASLSYSASECW